MSKVAVLIREMLSSGLTQVEIARRTGIPQPRISRWAAGNVSAGADDALRLLELHRAVTVQAGSEACAELREPQAGSEASAEFREPANA